MSNNYTSMMYTARANPEWWINNVIGNTIWAKQRDIVESVRDNQRTTVRSCNGAGKSFISSNIVAWFLCAHPESIVITSAPTARQVEEILWQEIARIHGSSNMPLGGNLLKTKWDMGAKWFALGLSTNDPNRFQGFHATDLLCVLDEACGIEPQIYEAVEAIITSKGNKLLLIGNPTEPDNEFFKTFGSKLYNKIHISAFHTPNFRNIRSLEQLKLMSIKELEAEVTHPYLITPKWARERLEEWGEDSPAFVSRILGEFPDTGTQTLIPLSWIMKATMRHDKSDKPCTFGVDVARFGDDSSVIVVRIGSRVERIIQFNKLDTVDIANHVEQVYQEYSKVCELIAVDSVGIGAGVADMLRKRGLPTIDIESGEKAYQYSRFNNKRTEMWYRGRELFRTGDISIPDDDTLIGELSTIRYSFDVGGRYVLETKDDLKKRGLKSPNIADALMYAFAYDGKYDSYIAKHRQEGDYPKGTVGAIIKELEKSIKGLEENDPWRF